MLVQLCLTSDLEKTSLSKSLKIWLWNNTSFWNYAFKNFYEYYLILLPHPLELSIELKTEKVVKVMWAIYHQGDKTDSGRFPLVLPSSYPCYLTLLQWWCMSLSLNNYRIFFLSNGNMNSSDSTFCNEFLFLQRLRCEGRNMWYR